ncbi:hypothetical protein CRUP_001997, partial [Coryphaenoides rupestris]
PPSWTVSAWSKCSVTCGDGWCSRQVSCKRLASSGASRTLPATACEGAEPPDRQQCSSNSCPAWVSSSWGKVHGQSLRSDACRRANKGSGIVR